MCQVLRLTMHVQIERLHRLQGLAETMGGSISKVKMSTPDDFFKQLEVKSETAVRCKISHASNVSLLICSSGNASRRYLP